MKELRLGCYLFKLHRPLEGVLAWRLKKLASEGGPAHNPAFAYAWLRQNRIGFRLRFKWDRSKPVRYNLSKLEEPWMLRRLMDAYDNEVMALPLDGYAGRKHKPETEENT